MYSRWMTFAGMLLMVGVMNGQRPNSPEFSEGQEATDSIHRLARDTAVRFLWLEMRFDPEFGDSISTIVLNEDYIATMPEEERAAVGYIATFVGNECWWDGDYTSDRSNLKCVILSALGLGYQCSEQHLGFLRKWFRGDSAALARLRDEDCITMPYTATVQSSFDQISLARKGDVISLDYSGGWVHLRDGISVDWQFVETFGVKDKTLHILDTDTVRYQIEYFETDVDE